MIKVILFGAISGLSLVFGSSIGTIFHLKQRIIAFFMAFGSGVLICALTFGLMEEAFRHGGFDAIIIGFLGGGAVFILGDYLVHIRGGRKHKKHQHPISSEEAEDAKEAKEANETAITLGVIIDGIPESIALGVALFANQSLGILMLIAIVLSNFPEGISSVPGLQKIGFSKTKIFLLWLIVALITVLITVLSFTFLSDLNLNNLGIIEAFAAGAILAMLADSMMPEAYEEGGFSIALATILGFLTAFIVSKF